MFPSHDLFEPNIVINIPEQKTETKTIIKEVPVKEKKEKEQEIIW